ncbi:MAG: YfiR family protein [Halioglobus sp.]
MITPPVQAKAFSESDIKAAFLYYFLYFISWPDSDVDNTSNPLKFCVLDANPVTQALELILASPKAVNTVVERHVISDPAEAATCNYVYLDSKHSASAALVLAATRGKAILTVSDNDGFASAGGMIELKRESNKVKVRINLEVLSGYGLKASSKLLNLADIVSAPDLQGAINDPVE